jgi:hypothetical protein
MLTRIRLSRGKQKTTRSDDDVDADRHQYHHRIMLFFVSAS